MCDTIYSTGVFLKAEEIEINGTKQWRWVATSIEGDCFKEGTPIMVHDYAQSLDGLFVLDEANN